MTQCAIKDDYATLTMNRVFDADIDTLFKAWTDPQMLGAWFGPDGIECSRVKVDLQTGGQYEFVLQTPEGDIKHYGEYVLIEPPKKLVFTWLLDPDNLACTGSSHPGCSTLVTIDFIAHGGSSTEVVLTHEQLPDKESCEGHQFGWGACMESLAQWLD